MMIETSVVNSGAEKLIAIAPASGTRLNAMIRKVCEQNCENDRITWWRSRRVRNTISPVVGRMNSAQAMSDTSERVNSTSPTG